MQLLELQPGTKATIMKIDGGRSLLTRLASLGFTPGAELYVIRRAAHGPLLVSLRGSSLALGQGEAAHVLVEVKEEKKPAKVKRCPNGEFLSPWQGSPMWESPPFSIF